MGKKILIIAGEASSDLHAADLVKEIRELLPSVEFFGLGGERMQKAGVKLYDNIVELAVVGFIEVLKNIGKFKAIFDNILTQVDELKPEIAVLIDYPGFNLRLAKELKKRNIPVIYYISPQIWAWGKNRIYLIKKLVRRMIVLFRFEEEIYKKAGIPVNFVGHPFLDIPRYASRLAIPENKTTLALLPGSRELEVRRLLPVMLESAKLILKKIPDSQFILLYSSSVKREIFEEILKGYELPLYIFTDKTYEGLNSSDFALIASGSATLESSVLEKPFVVLYKVSALSWLLLRMIIKLPYIGLVNIVAGKKIIEEFIQFRAQPEKICDYIT
ncbi:MAG: lipid-A-disaccharide synthase, partial [Candidatus Omnitrophica bacterium]|nr:lipid-A-disaccharide synthase [Candidatus Omnitrophota bacterium]